VNLTDTQYLQSIWAALRRIEDNMALPPAPLELPAPQVTVTAPDLTDIVTAVQSLHGTGPTPEDIARAIADVLAPARSDDGGEALRAVAEGLKLLDHRLQGMGRQAYGGGAVSFSPAGLNQLAGAVSGLTDAQLRASRVPVDVEIDQPLTDTQLRASALPVSLVNQLGAWSYRTGASGTVNVASGERVIGIAAHATVAGSITVAGGASIPIPAGTQMQFSPLGNISGPIAIVMTGTDSYLVEILI
jgi:hypothetical protein